MKTPPLSLASRLFGLDPRSLAVYRIALGALIAVDAVDRLRDVTALYTDAGAYPSTWMTPSAARLSLPFAVAGHELAAFWLVCMGLAGVAMALGWRTRWATLVCWVLTVSLQARNPYVMFGADLLLRAMLFWAIFLPLDQVASLDRRAGRASAPEQTTVSAASVAYTVQIAVLYLVTAVLKTGRPWHDGTAGWYAVQIDIFTGPLGVWIRQYTGILWLGTWATIILEYAGPVLLFVPWFHAWVRTFLVAAFVVFHLSLEAMLEIGWFPWVSAACWLPFLPGAFWDKVGWWESTALGRARSSLAWGVDAFVGACLVVVIWWNLGTLDGQHFAVRGPVRAAMIALRLDQNWNMYAPAPLRDDGWWIAKANLRSGATLDLVTGERPTTSKPLDVSGHYGSSRWNKYMRALWSKDATYRQGAYIEWGCRRYNSSPNGVRDPARDVTLTFVRETTPRIGAKAKPPEPVDVLTQACDRRAKPVRTRRGGRKR